MRYSALMKKTVITFLFAVLSSPLLAEPSDYFSYKLGDDYNDVLARIDRTDFNNCAKDFGVANYPFRKGNAKIWTDSRPTKLHERVKNETVYRIMKIGASDDCKLERVEQMDFCPTNGKLIHYSVNVMKNDYSIEFALSSEGEEFFVGYGQDDELLGVDFSSGSYVTFDIENKDLGFFRSSTLFTGRDSFNDVAVYHAIFPNTKKTSYELYVDLCPDGEPIEILPLKYNSLDRMISSSAEMLYSFQRNKAYYSYCISTFTEESETFLANWNTYKANNEVLVSDVVEKVKRVLAGYGNSVLYDQYLFNIRYLRNRNYSSSLSAEGCRNVSERETDLIRFNEDATFILEFVVE